MALPRELDNLRCTAIKQDKQRCTRTATHSNGKGVLCETHHQEHLKKLALIQRKEKK